MSSTQIWLDGDYKLLFAGNLYGFANVKGENVGFLDDENENVKNKLTIKSGDFKETDPKISEKTGKSNYNVVMHDTSDAETEIFGVVSVDGKSINCRGAQGWMFTMEWIEEAEAEELKAAGENDKDPADAPSNHYTLRPGHVGKLVWVSGAPGYGKSTTARRMMEKEGFVYYEGDCFMSHKNPYLPIAENSAIDALIMAKSLKGVPKEKKEAVEQSMKEWIKLLKGEEDYNLEEFYTLLCENIIHERKRVGGDWVVAQAVPTRRLRDLIKTVLGPELLFVVLDLEKEHQKERLRPRIESFGEDVANSWMGMKYEPAEDDEENAFDLKITREMELDDVVGRILNKLD